MTNAMPTTRELNRSAVTHRRSMSAAICFLWLGTVGLAQIFTVIFRDQAIAVSSPAFEVAKTAALVLFAAATTVCFVCRPYPGIRIAFAALPLVAVWLISIANVQGPLSAADAAIVPTLLLLAASCSSVDNAMSEIARWSTVSVTGALMMGLLAPQAGLYRYGEQFQFDKPILPIGVLQGGFSSANNLGTFAALAFVATLIWGRRRFLCSTLALVVVVWSASRSSLVVVVAVAVLYVISRRTAGRPPWPAIVFSAILVMILLPILASADQFSGRGRIWDAVQNEMRGHELLGLGTDFFAQTVTLGAGGAGQDAVQGHNIWLHLAATQGLIVSSVAIAWIATGLFRRSISRIEGSVPLYICALVIIGFFEVPLGFVDRFDFALLALLPLTLFSATHVEGDSHLSGERQG